MALDQNRIQKTYVDVKGELALLDKKRKSTQVFRKITWLLTAGYFVLMLLIGAANYFPKLKSSYPAFFQFFESTPTNPYASAYPMFGLIFLLYVSTSVFVRRFRNFKIQESAIMTKMVKQLFPKVDFTQNIVAPAHEVVKSKLFSWIKKDGPIFSYGQLRTKANDVEINIADIGIIEDNISNKMAAALMRIPILNMIVIGYKYILKNIFSNQSADNLYYSFRGMFGWLRFKKKLNGHTVVLPHQLTTQLDRLASFNFTEEQRVHLEDPRFTNQFVVYSTDQVEARYVLSVALMERITLFAEKFKKPIFLSFQNQQLFIAIKNENGLFSFPTGRLDAVEVIEELASDVTTALQMANALG